MTVKQPLPLGLTGLICHAGYEGAAALLYRAVALCNNTAALTITAIAIRLAMLI
jgi:hypothetical protein